MTEQTYQPLSVHIMELRKRLLWAFVFLICASAISYVYVTDIYAFLIQPLADALGDDAGQRLIYTGLTEAFFTYIKLAFVSGLFVTSPVLLLQVWKFIAPGLYKNERRAFWPFLIATPVLFIGGAAVVYYVVMPLTWPFFAGFQTSADQTTLPIQLETRVSEYLDFILALIFAFGLCFQLPVLMALLGRAGIITADTLRKGRKYAIIIIFILAAFLTPPDIISQVILALPVLLLYELSIFLVGRGDKQLEKPDQNPQ